MLPPHWTAAFALLAHDRSVFTCLAALASTWPTASLVGARSLRCSMEGLGCQAPTCPELRFDSTSFRVLVLRRHAPPALAIASSPRSFVGVDSTPRAITPRRAPAPACCAPAQSRLNELPRSRGNRRHQRPPTGFELPARQDPFGSVATYRWPAVSVPAPAQKAVPCRRIRLPHPRATPAARARRRTGPAHPHPEPWTGDVLD